MKTHTKILDISLKNQIKRTELQPKTSPTKMDSHKITGKKPIKFWMGFLISCAIFIVLFVLLTTPLVSKMTSEFPLLNPDVYQFLGRYKTILTGEQNFLQFAWNQDLPTTSLAILEIWTGNEALSYNIWFFLSFLLAFVGGYLLQHYITKNHISAFLTAFLFAMVPFHFLHNGHRGTMFYGILAFFVLFLMRYLEKMEWKKMIPLIMVFAVTAKTEHHLTYFAFVIAGFFLLYYIANKKILFSKRTWTQFIVIALSAASIVALFHVGSLKVANSEENYLDPGISQVIKYSSDLISPVLAPEYSLILGKTLTTALKASESLPELFDDYRGYLGIVMIASIVLFFVFSKHITENKQRVWIYMGIVFLVLSFGPVAKFIDQELRFIPLPYLLVYQYIPYADIVRTVSRFAIVGILGFSMVAGLLLSLAKQKLKPKFYYPIFVSVLLVACLEFGYFQIPMSKMEVPEFYSKVLANDDEDFTIAQIPGNYKYSSASRFLYYNTFHDHKTISNRDFAREGKTNWTWLENMPILGDILYDIPQGRLEDMVNHDIPNIAPAIFAEQNLRYIIVHEDYFGNLPKDLSRLKRYLEKTGCEIYYEEPNITVYKTPEFANNENANYIRLGGGFERIDEDLQKITDEKASIVIKNSSNASLYLTAELRFRLEKDDPYSTNFFREFTLKYNDQEIGKYQIGEKEIVVQIPQILTNQGESEIVLDLAAKNSEIQGQSDGSIVLKDIKYFFNKSIDRDKFTFSERNDKALFYKQALLPNTENAVLRELNASIFDLSGFINDKKDLALRYPMIRHWYFIDEGLEKRLNWDYFILNKQFAYSNETALLTSLGIKYFVFDKNVAYPEETKLLSDYICKNLGCNITRDDESYKILELNQQNSGIMAITSDGWGRLESPGSDNPYAPIEGVGEIKLIYSNTNPNKKYKILFSVNCQNESTIQINLNELSAFEKIDQNQKDVEFTLPNLDPGIHTLTIQQNSPLEDQIYIKGIKIIEE